MFQKLCFLILILLSSACAKAQQKWPSPEVEQMYKHAEEYMAMGNFPDAIITFKQAILLAPDTLLLYKELGKACYAAGNYSDAEQTLAPLEENTGTDAECYRLLAASQAAQKETKKALATLKKGLKRFPASGLLYHEAGNIYDKEKKTVDALNAWLDGIVKDPAYPQNYYDAAEIYLRSDNVTWGLLYGEIFLDIPHDTAGDDSLKKMLFAGWKTMFDHIAPASVPEYGEKDNKTIAGSFTAAVKQVYTSLTPVISDGVTVENLTMVRTRFLMDWFGSYGNKYPFALFSYQDNLIRNGKFEIYNEWLFGKAESELEFDAWNKFHPGDISRFLDWKSAHPLHPASTDLYNERDMEGIGKKLKK